MFNIILPVIMMIIGSISFTFKRKHLLSTLLNLEFIVLSLFYLLCVYFMGLEYEYFFTMIFLTFSVCEGALGLSILVSMIRTHGNDCFKSFNMMQC
uniref:NADH-ubiquinone oxidoreductase chain 4L n=2 Tax=Rapisma TaxID=560872 RepID=V9PP01_9NEOP|nr:NADH dehydrogenase subunit 4L [Rapisma xizangense]YP_009000270.1 NADH dehydrogenase subunit 4L [Rapisma zayuanum]AHA35663.1 NADH dehydrogenase subunit 4L [Rapisma xizangense]AHA35676.1 NADH dehydrogenase subunit 4L [Rapisma zayuanum]ARO47941.1 NADH dehydrogenase subunit 4L [Rapisma sp. 1 NS-2017]